MEALLPVLLPRASDYGNCTVDTCPVKDSLYGYAPSKPMNIIFVILFLIAFIAHLWQGIKWKSLTFLIALGVGTVREAIGTWIFETYSLDFLLIERRIHWSSQVTFGSIQQLRVRLSLLRTDPDTTVTDSRR